MKRTSFTEIMELIQTIENLNNKSWEYGLTDRELSYEYASDSYLLSKEINYLPGLAHSYLNLGWYYIYERKYVIALGLFKMSREIYTEIDDKLGVTKALSGIYSGYFFSGQYAYSIDISIESIILAEQLGDKERIIVAYTNASTTLRKINDGEKALNFALKAFELLNEYDSSEDLTLIVYHNVGGSYMLIGEYEKAIKYVFKAHEIAVNNDIKIGVYDTFNSLGEIYYNLGEIDKAKECYDQVFKLCKGELHCEDFILDISRFYYNILDISNAQKYLKESIDLSIKNNMEHTLLSAYELLVENEACVDDDLSQKILEINSFFDIAKNNRLKEKELLKTQYGILTN